MRIPLRFLGLVLGLFCTVLVGGAKGIRAGGPALDGSGGTNAAEQRGAAVGTKSTARVDQAAAGAWIRVNLLGYLPSSPKVAVWCSKDPGALLATKGGDSFWVKALPKGNVVFRGKAQPYGAYGPFAATARLDFSALQKAGRYVVQVGSLSSPAFDIGAAVYAGTADFTLRYLRQQRSGFNPFLQDSCHTHDGYTLYGAAAGLRDSSFIDVSGGWHDASDYLQYGTTSANTVYHLLAAYRDFPKVFADGHQGNGLRGRNGVPDVVDEARWGLDWLLKMHPAPQWLFNQLGDDRDHMGMRIPKEDTYYGRGFERPVYFVDGAPQQRGKFLNATTGTSSTAAKYSAAFSLAARLFPGDPLATLYKEKAQTALDFALQKPGVTQTASVRSPYIYAEENWTDDVEWAYAAQAPEQPAAGSQAFLYAQMEKITPWLGRDTAAHYQWYPFVNMGHAELLRTAGARQRDSLLHWYKQGIQAVARKAQSNAFNRGIPFIWCSNNLTVAFALQCYWYRNASGDKSFQALEQACLDWVLGNNPWGTSMVVGLPQGADYPVDPHTAFTHLKNYPIYGGLVDGPVYGSIFNNLIGIALKDADEYAAFQSNLAVYHDDYGDYSTNEPTLDGTAVLTYLLAAQEAAGKQEGPRAPHGLLQQGAFVRAASKNKIALVFTADEFTEGLDTILNALKAEKVPAGFFFTGRAYRSPAVAGRVARLQKEGHLLGPHSDQHLLYNDWNKRDSLLLSYAAFKQDLDQNRKTMDSLGMAYAQQRYFIPPYEWWNDSIATWTHWEGLHLFSFTPGSRTNADYTWPEMGKAYRSSASLLQAVYEASAQPKNFGGSILLVHAGTDPRRKDKFYLRLLEMVRALRSKGYVFERVDRLLEE